jgi:signal transduction histidine kinase
MSHPKSMVLWKATLLTALCGLVIFGLWWWGLVHSVETQGRARAADSIAQMRQTIAREFQRAEGSGVAFGSWWSREKGSLDDPEKLQSVIPFLERGAIITNLILSRQDGDSACVVRLDGAWNLLLFKAGRNPKRYLVRQGRWVPGPMSGREVYDARQRHWYQFGAAQTAPAWTPEAYRYYESEVAGFTFTIPVRNPQGELEGVIGVDVSLEELTQLIWEGQPTPNSRTFVTDADGRLLVPPRVAGMMDLRTRFHRQLTPLSRDLLGSLQSGKTATPPGEDLRLLDPEGAYVGAAGSFSSPGTPRMDLHIAIPKDDLFPGQRRYAALTFLLALALVIGVAWTLLDLHRRLVLPMRLLAEGAAAQDGGSAEEMAFNSDIWELQQVGEKLHLAGRADQERQRLLSQVEHNQRVNSVGIMAPGIVHDVNNQLTMVLGQITKCRTVLEAHPELQPHLRAAEGATIQCTEVLHALMDYSRPDQGRRERLSLNVVVEEAASLLRRALGQAIQIQMELSRNLPLLFGDQVKLQQVLVNLGLNARDAMPEGGLLTFRTFGAREKVCLEVRDTGCGMSEDVKLRVFEPFFSTKAPDKGTGLGLAMVANIVAAHSGHLHLESEPGLGTLFRIEFPAYLRKKPGLTDELAGQESS